MNLDAFLELLTPRGQRALAEATELASRSQPVTAATVLRRSHPAELASAALTQAGLRGRAAAKFGADAARMYFTPEGLEQATRPEVAAHRAHRFRTRPDARVADLCCGIGGDAIELARAGCTVDASDRDALTSAVAQANLDALGLSSQASVRTASAGDADPRSYDALFLDPARRTSARRVFDPMAYSPPWPEVMELAGAAKMACLKVAPGLPYEFVPEGAEVEWVSYRGEVKEAAIWMGAAAEAGKERFLRRATLLPSGVTLVADPELGPAEHGTVGRYLYEPDGAAIRAHLVAEVAASVRGTPARSQNRLHHQRRSDPDSVGVLLRDTRDDAFLRKRLRAALRTRGVGEVTIKKRGSAVDIDQLRKDLKPSGDKSMVVVLTRIANRPFAHCDPADQP